MTPVKSSKNRGESWLPVITGMRPMTRRKRKTPSVKGFVLAWALMLFAFLAVAYSIRLVPESISEVGDSIFSILTDGTHGLPGNISENMRAYIAEANDPTPKILIPTIGVNAPITFPVTTDIDGLNNDLLHGVVHYPTSARPGDMGNVFFFGHSTGLAVVHNKSFAVFNRIHELKNGDVIRVRYSGREYWYQVTSVTMKKASAALVDLAPGGRKLTLTTCQVFGAKDDRYIVEADFVKSYPLQTYTVASKGAVR